MEAINTTESPLIEGIETGPGGGELTSLQASDGYATIERHNPSGLLHVATSRFAE